MADELAHPGEVGGEVAQRGAGRGGGGGADRGQRDPLGRLQVHRSGTGALQGEVSRVELVEQLALQWPIAVEHDLSGQDPLHGPGVALQRAPVDLLALAVGQGADPDGGAPVAAASAIASRSAALRPS
ncbi:hypothetical protein [Kitasatospora sp. NPDC088783]|uniref:hypothetical protein n=1 Tax=Kitasatospora sp. NPDC088783 TaxID=3364077 RepID=UPI003801C913